MTAEFNELGYKDITVDRGKNLIIGDVQNAKVIYSAHYDTPPLSPWFFLARIFGHIIGAVILGNLVVLAVIMGICILVEGLVSGQFLTVHSAFALNAGWLVFMLLFIFPSPGNANDNTSGVLAVYEIARRLRDQGKEAGVAFVFFSAEELGLIGSGKFKVDLVKAAKRTNPTAKFNPKFTLVNFDCVGLGTHVVLAYGSKKSKVICDKLAGGFDKPTLLRRGSLLAYGSDNLHFKDNGISIFAAKRSILGPLYLPRIHAPFNKKIDLDIVKAVCEGVLRADLG